MEDLCTECQRWGQLCMWPSKNRQKACLPCTNKCINCMQDGESVTQCASRKTRGSPSKRCWVSTLEVLELGSDDTRVWKTSKGSQKEQTLWKIVHALEQLEGEQSGIWEEMVKIQESSERMEDIPQDLVD